MKNKSKNKDQVYGILAILLGGIGIHKFYNGEYLKGFIFLAFCWTWIPFFISLYDGIVVLIGKAESSNAEDLSDMQKEAIRLGKATISPDENGNPKFSWN